MVLETLEMRRLFVQGTERTVIMRRFNTNIVILMGETFKGLNLVAYSSKHLHHHGSIASISPPALSFVPP